MTSKEVTVIQWQCEACDVTLRADTNDLPNGWSQVSVEIDDLCTKGADVCPQCSQDIKPAKHNVKKRWGKS